MNGGEWTGESEQDFQQLELFGNNSHIYNFVIFFWVNGGEWTGQRERDFQYLELFKDKFNFYNFIKKFQWTEGSERVKVNGTFNT